MKGGYRWEGENSMVVTLTEPALNKLKEMVFKDEQSPRIDANITGGCGMSIKFMLVFDEPRRNDIIIEHEGIEIRIDHFTKKYLDTEVKIDCNDENDFLIGNNYESNSCAIELG